LARAEDTLVVARALEVDAAEQLGVLLDLGTEATVELVAADAGEVVALGIEEGVLEVGARRFDGRGLAGTGPLVDLEQRLLLGGRQLALLLPLPLEEVEVADVALQQTRRALLVVAEGPEEDEQREAALAGHACAGRHVLAGLLLDGELGR